MLLLKLSGNPEFFCKNKKLKGLGTGPGIFTFPISAKAYIVLILKAGFLSTSFHEVTFVNGLKVKKEQAQPDKTNMVNTYLAF